MVDELGQGDVSVMAKDMDILEVGVGAVDEGEVADIKRRAAELNGDGGGEVSWKLRSLALSLHRMYECKRFRVLLGDASWPQSV